MSNAAENRRIIAAFWDDLYAKRYDALGAYFAPDAHYTDKGAREGATGPDEIVRQLRLGHGPVPSFEHHVHHVLAEGDIVVTEHQEDWHFGDGVVVEHPFCSVQELRDGKIVRWWDYSHLNNLVDNAPKWWIEHIMSGGTPSPE
jgi:limonene-1,2-epoxide hydrolase